MIQDTLNTKHYIADRGMVFRRLSDGFVFGEELYLGYAYYIGGELLDTPREEQIEDFEEVLISDLENEEEFNE